MRIKMDKDEIREIFKTCKNLMKPDGLKTQEHQLPQLSWVLLLKCFDYYEKERLVIDKNFVEGILKPYRWKDWAGVGDKGINAEKLITFVNYDLFPKLAKLESKKGAESRVIISNAFNDFNNRVLDGYALRKIVNEIDKIKIDKDPKILISLEEAYQEELIEWINELEKKAYFFTPRPLVNFIVSKIKPNFKKKERVFDPAFGLGGFLIESLLYMKKDEKEEADVKKLRFESLVSQEKNTEFYLCGVLNMMLQGISIPNALNVNSLARPTKEIPPEGEFEVVMTNPSYNEPESDDISDNLPYEIKTKDSALHFLFLVMEELKDKGRAAIILPNGPLFGKGKATKIKQRLLEKFNLHTIIRLPESIFAPRTDIKTNVLFFEKGIPTKEIWYYDMKIPDRILNQKKNIKKPGFSKALKLLIEDFDKVSKWFDNRTENDDAWKVNVTDVLVKEEKGEVEINLDIKNPNDKDETIDLSPHELISQIISDEKKTLKLLEDVEKLIDKEIPK